MIIKKAGKTVGIIEDRMFKKHLTDESIHLFWKFGGVPCIDAETWDTHKTRFDRIEITTHKGNTFKISREKFDANKKDFNLGYNKQYYVGLEEWEKRSKDAQSLPPAFKPQAKQENRLI